MRATFLAIALVLAACADPNEGDLRQVAASHSFESSSNAPMRHVHTIEFTLPRHFSLDVVRSSGEVIGIDKSGRRFKPIGLVWNKGSKGERLKATFDIPEQSDIHSLEIGDFDVDLEHSRIRRARTTVSAR